jgi:hypothetical protein
MVFEQVLNIVENEKFLLKTITDDDPKSRDKISEADIQCKIWTPILNGVVNITSRLRLKIGETVPPSAPKTNDLYITILKISMASKSTVDSFMTLVPTKLIWLCASVESVPVMPKRFGMIMISLFARARMFLIACMVSWETKSKIAFLYGPSNLLG